MATHSKLAASGSGRQSMGKLTDLRIVAARHSVESIDYRTPIKFGGRVVTSVQLLHVQIEVENRAGKRGVGYGSMPLGNVWAWPTSSESGERTLEAMRVLGERLTDAAPVFDVCGHPTDFLEPLAHLRTKIARDLATDLQLAEPIPVLAQLVAASPLEAALFDAHGRIDGVSSYSRLSGEYMNCDLSHCLDQSFAGEYLDKYTLAAPKSHLPLYHLVGALDPLFPSDVKTPVSDGLPETLGDWIEHDSLTRLKIKLAGDDLAWDVERVINVERAATETQAKLGRAEWRYSLDFNEKCANVDYVIEFLNQLKDRSPLAFDRIEYLEQPTHRDLKRFPDNKMHAAAAIKPVVIDESLIDYESLLLARDLGYSGVALKACKGQCESLILAAAAQKFGMFLCVQDLTCPGMSFLQSASLAAHVPTVAAIEGNARQFCPAGNEKWAKQYPSVFEVREGQIETAVLNGAGIYGDVLNHEK
jgi:L-alanine-DL-glutamate epimerase-like enolase superfamily enzyme